MYGNSRFGEIVSAQMCTQVPSLVSLVEGGFEPRWVRQPRKA